MTASSKMTAGSATGEPANSATAHGIFRRLRSIILLVVIGALLAAVVAGVLVLVVWGISVGVHHVSTN